MSKSVVISVALFFLVTQVLTESVTSPQQQPQLSPNTALANARKIRLLTMNPSVIKLYRLLGGGSTGAVLRQSLEDGDAVQDDESYFQKRQYDDYGHMRFGKRNPKDFDDYGHMRFGKK